MRVKGNLVGRIWMSVYHENECLCTHHLCKNLATCWQEICRTGSKHVKTKVPANVQNYFALYLHSYASMLLVPCLESINLRNYYPCVLLAVLPAAYPFRRETCTTCSALCTLHSVYVCVIHILRIAYSHWLLYWISPRQ